MRKKTLEDYVEMIYILEADHDPVHTNEVAEAFHISPSSVTEMFQKLRDEGYLTYQPYAGVSLTNKGRTIAKQTLQSHDVLKKFLLLLGMDEQTADEDACRIEHVIHPETLLRLRKFVEFTHHKEMHPKWLEHFQIYFTTGEHLCCSEKEKEKQSVD